MIELLEDLKLIIYKDVFPVAEDNNIICNNNYKSATLTALLLHSLSHKCQGLHINVHFCQCQCCLNLIFHKSHFNHVKKIMCVV